MRVAAPQKALLNPSSCTHTSGSAPKTMRELHGTTEVQETGHDGFDAFEVVTRGFIARNR